MVQDKKPMANDGAVRITEGLLKKGGLINPPASAIAMRPAPPPPQNPTAPPSQLSKPPSRNNDK